MFNLNGMMKALVLATAAMTTGVITVIWLVCKYVVPHVHVWWS